jgi:hypothetical protein
MQSANGVGAVSPAPPLNESAYERGFASMALAGLTDLRDLERLRECSLRCDASDKSFGLSRNRSVGFEKWGNGFPESCLVPPSERGSADSSCSAR